MAENDTSWMDRYLNPTATGFRRFMRGQERQYNPLIRLLGEQYRGARPGEDPMVKAFDDLISRQRTGEQVGEQFRGARERIASMISGSPLGAGGERVSSLLSAIGGAIGADAAETGLTAEGAKTPGVDAMRLAFQTGAESRLSGAEQEALSGLEQRMQELTLGRGEALGSAEERRRELGRLLAQTRGQRMGARMNPLEIAQMLGSFQDWQKSRRGGYGGGFSYAASNTESGNGGGGSGSNFDWGALLGGNPSARTISPVLPGGSGSYNIYGAAIAAGLTPKEAKELTSQENRPYWATNR